MDGGGSAKRRWVLGLASLCAVAACKPPAKGSLPVEAPLFERLDSTATGIRFTNTLPEDSSFNILNYLYYYNGGGVAVGDIDNDGLPDLYFSSNLGPNRLYRNRGQFQFEDITERAGVQGGGPEGWKTGVAMADVNGDGFVDIYVSAVSYLTMHGRNVLYINNGNGTFTDRTREFGLEHVGYSTQAAFFDYDGDRDLDMFLLSHSTHTERGIGKANRDVRSSLGGGRLYRNDGGHFVDVSAKAGIYGGIEGFGLGLVVTDVNGDGCPDVYVANDFQENDFLYRNNCDGTFTESLTSAMGHTSRYSMGVDAADMNNDGRPDIFVGDMLPEREDVLKTSSSFESTNLFNLRLRAGYHPQYARNTLQLNRGEGKFSEIGYLAGVFATDWSWAPLFADLDNDGAKDLFITNGIYRRPNDLDYINYVGNEAIQASLAQGISAENMSLLQRMPQIPLANHAYRNNGDLTFTDKAAAWGLGEPGFSNGAAYADLDNDGSLDLVVNRINAPAAVYRGRARDVNKNHFVTIVLHGDRPNTAGVGARVVVKHGAVTQMLEQAPTRGFQSSVDPRLHFGLGSSTRVDSLTVVWPDRRFQVLTNVDVDRIMTLTQGEATGRWQKPQPMADAARFLVDESATTGIDYHHVENSFNDIDREPLMPHLLSAEGPALAVADANGDGLDDLFVGGGKWQPGEFFAQQHDGTFRVQAEPAIAADSLAEDVDAVFLDANGDGKKDLFVVAGGNEFWGDAAALQPRLYLNNGAGHFSRVPDAVPGVFANASCVVAGDFDGDGDIDLFIGARVVARRYGETPRSYLLQNDGTGHFTDVTDQKAPALAKAGMVTSAAWVDYDGDRQLDLVVAGEWMPVRVFRQDRGVFVERTKEAGLGESGGWWSSVLAVDLTGDGRDDLVLGNLGLNSYIKASLQEPARLYVGDFGHTGTLEQILTFYKHGVSYPLPGRDDLVRLLPALRSRYTSYKAFGASRVEEIFPAPDLRAAQVSEARTFASAVAINTGKGAFHLTPLPPEAQFAPARATVAADVDGDGHLDLFVAGNDFGAPPSQGRYDASYGVLLKGAGDGQFRAVDLEQSHAAIDGQVRHMAVLRRGTNERLVVIARNGGTLQFLRLRK